MGTVESVAAVQVALSRLEESVTGLGREYGDTLGVRRLRSDLRRLREDLDELGDPAPTATEWTPLQPISDTPYDRSMWEDADDEGLGAPDRHAP